MADDKFIIIHSKRLLDPQSEPEEVSELDLPLDEEYFPYATGYLRLLSDLTKMGYKLIIASEHKDGKETSEFEKLFEHCEGLGIETPQIHAKFFYKTMLRKPTGITTPRSRSNSLSLDSIKENTGRKTLGRNSLRMGRSPALSRKRGSTVSTEEAKEIVPESLLEYKDSVKGKFQIHFANYYPSTSNNMRTIIERALKLKTSKRSKCFVFCDPDFPKKEYEGYQKKLPPVKGRVPTARRNRAAGLSYLGNMNTKTFDSEDTRVENWTFDAFFKTLSGIYLKSTPSPEHVFERLIKYGEFFVDKSKKIFFPDDFPLEDVTPDEILRTIDESASMFNGITAGQWAKLAEIKNWVSHEGDEVFLSKKITGLDVSKLNAHKMKGKSPYDNMRPVRENANGKADELTNLLDDFLPNYVDSLEGLLRKLQRSSERLRSRGYEDPSDTVDELHDHIERELYWLNNYYEQFEEQPFVRLYGLISCVEDSLECIRDFMDEDGENYDAGEVEKLCGLDVLKNIAFFLFATLTVIPMVIHLIKYQSQVKIDKRVSFAFFTPQNELIKLHQDAEKIVQVPTRGIEVR